MLLCILYYVCINFEVPFLSEHLKHIDIPEFLNFRDKRSFITEDGKFSGSTEYFQNAYNKKKHNIPANGSGKVVRLLPDQSHLVKRQRFVISLSSGQNLEIRHKLSDGKRLPIKIGDMISFSGIYNWNYKGGLIEKTYKDKHASGWIKHNGRMYK